MSSSAHIDRFRHFMVEVDIGLNDERLLVSTDTSPFTDKAPEMLFDIPVPGQSSLFGCFQILLNTAIGSGTLMVPYTYTAGMGLALLVSAIFGILAYMAMHFLIDASNYCKKYDYHGLFAHCFGPKLIWILNVMVLLVQFGAMMIYSHWNGKLVNHLINYTQSVIVGSNSFWIALVTAVVVFPLTIFRQISKLEKFAMLSTFFIILLIVHSVYWFVKGYLNGTFDERKSQFVAFDFSKWKVVIAAFSVNSMAFNCHINLFACLENLRNCTIKRARALGIITVAVAFLLYHIFGTFTYLYLFDELSTHESALEYYDHSDPFTIVTICGVILILVISSPIVCWAARNSLNMMIWKDKPMTNVRWVSIGGGICLVASFLASSSDNVLLFFDLVGGLFTPMIILLFPAVFFLRICKEASLGMKALAGVTAAFTIVGAGACTYQAIDEIINAAK